MKTKPETLSATEFKAKCLRILENLGPEGFTVTKRGRPIARVTPVSAVDNGKFYGSLKGKIKIKGDNLLYRGQVECSNLTPTSRSILSLELAPGASMN